MKTLKMVLDSGECPPENALAVFKNEFDLCKDEREQFRLVAFWLEWHGLGTSPEEIQDFIENMRQ